MFYKSKIVSMHKHSFTRLMLLLAILLIPSISTAKPYEKYEDMLADFKNLSLDTSKVFSVSDFTITREDAVFKFNSGSFIFCKPLNGRYMAVLFMGDMTFDFTPPSKVESRQLARMLGKDEVHVKSKSVFMFFADSTLYEIEKSCKKTTYRWNEKHKDIVKRYVEYEQDDRKTELDNSISQVLLNDVHNEYMTVVIMQDNKDDLLYQIDPYFKEEVFLHRGTFYAYDRYYEVINQYSKKSQSEVQGPFFDKLFQISKYVIDVNLDNNLDFTGKASIDLTVKNDNYVWMQFYLNEFLNLKSAKLSDGSSLYFYKPEKSHRMWVKIPKVTEPYTPLRVFFEYSGNFLDRFGNSTYMKSASTWYPLMENQPKMFFDLQMTYPSNYTVVAVGDNVQTEKKEFTTVSRWVTSEAINRASFSVGDFFKKEAASSDVKNPIEMYYRNTNFIDDVFQECSNTIKFFSKLYGPIPYKKIYTTEFPENYNESFPGLIHLAGYCFRSINTETFNTTFFAKAFADQWWGGNVLPESYHEDWLTDGLATYSGLIYSMAVKKESKKFFEYLQESQRDLLEAKKSFMSKGIGPGALYLGSRNITSKGKGDYSLVIMKKGAWVLHMLRNLMMDFESQDETSFVRLLKETYNENAGGYISTDFFKTKVNTITGEDYGWFFDQWVYDYNIPKYKFAYKIEKTITGKFTLKCRVEQEEVPDSFKMYVPISIELSDNTIRREKVLVTGRTSFFDFEVGNSKPKNVYFNDPASVLCELDYVNW